MHALQQLVAVASLTASLAGTVSATIAITQPGGTVSWTNGVSSPIAWTSEAGDPQTFSVILSNANSNTPIHLDSFAVADAVQTSAKSVFIETPSLHPGTGYVLKFINISDVNDVYAVSAPFEIKRAEVPTTMAQPSPSFSTAVRAAGATTASQLQPSSGSVAAVKPASVAAQPSSSSAAAASNSA